MSLLDEFARPCVILEKESIPDGAGGCQVAWHEGAAFTVYLAADTAAEARRAEKEGLTVRYSALVEREFPLQYNDVFQDTATGQTYRVTSDPAENAALPSATLPLKSFTAERWALTT